MSLANCFGVLLALMCPFTANCTFFPSLMNVVVAMLNCEKYELLLSACLGYCDNCISSCDK